MKNRNEWLHICLQLLENNTTQSLYNTDMDITSTFFTMEFYKETI